MYYSHVCRISLIQDSSSYDVDLFIWSEHARIETDGHQTDIMRTTNIKAKNRQEQTPPPSPQSPVPIIHQPPSHNSVKRWDLTLDTSWWTFVEFYRARNTRTTIRTPLASCVGASLQAAPKAERWCRWNCAELRIVRKEKRPKWKTTHDAPPPPPKQTTATHSHRQPSTSTLASTNHTATQKPRNDHHHHRNDKKSPRQ